MPYLETIGSGICESNFQWKIPNFLSLTVEKGYYYTSPSFYFSNNRFRLIVYLADTLSSESGFMSLYVENESKQSCYATITLSIKKSDGTLIKTLTHTNGNIVSSLGYTNFCEKSLLQQNDLIILCTLKHPDEKQVIVKEQGNKGDVDHKQLRELDQLSQNLKILLDNKDSCDVTLQLKDKELQAHKTILIARSPVFAAMFQHDTLEKQTGFVDIPDCDSESFPQFLEYLYCGCLEDVSFDSAFHLYSTSVKYDVQKLQEFCVKCLIGNLTADNVCDVIILADKYDDVKLLSGTQKFFNENCNKIFLTTEWENFMKNNCRLANKFLIEMSKTNRSH